ncbi:MAG: RluA family pseudouridine synthase [Fibrobacter sp.]|nr:RluA family pseudouridine synthase [Fibrobacter sp.]
MPVPSDMYFESVVQPEHEGWLLLKSLCARFTYHSEMDWVDKLARGLVTINGVVANAATVAHKNDKVVYHVENYTEPEVPTNYDIVFEDDEFMLVAKPAGVPVHHTGRIFYNTFTSIVRRGTDYETATPMHRLDRDTGGLMLFAKYAESAARFQKNLERILLRKFYMAVVRGNFLMAVPDCAGASFVSLGKDDAGEFLDCKMPLREDPADNIRLRMHFFEDGKECHTRFRVLKQGLLPNGEKYSVVEAELLTGRKHQIRAHLSELGFPILGDRLYSFGGKYYEKMTDKVAEARAKGQLSQEDALTEEDYAVLGGRSHMLYAYKAEIQLPYWRESRTFSCGEFPEDMGKLV